KRPDEARIHVDDCRLYFSLPLGSFGDGSAGFIELREAPGEPPIHLGDSKKCIYPPRSLFIGSRSSLDAVSDSGGHGRERAGGGVPGLNGGEEQGDNPGVAPPSLPPP